MFFSVYCYYCYWFSVDVVEAKHVLTKLVAACVI